MVPIAASAEGGPATAARAAVPPGPGAAWPVEAWMEAVLAWQQAAWSVNLIAMQWSRQALRPHAWHELGQQWADMLHNGPIPS